MAFSIPISVVLVLWATFVYSYHASIILVAASQSSTLKLEAEAICNSEWWSNYYPSNSTISTSPIRHCNWPGIACNNAGSVVQVSLDDSYYVGGKFKKFNFSCFPKLAPLDLSYNGLSGNILPLIGPLPKLELPPSLGKWRQLVELDISSNQINGSIPHWIGNLTNLVRLDVRENNLTGAIPITLGILLNLAYLLMQSNQINNVIPPEIGNLTKLIAMPLGSNNIYGSIPPEFGNLMNLGQLDLSNNRLTSPIPPTRGQLTNMRSLSLHINRLNSSITPTLGNLKLLSSLSLRANKIFGTMPRELGELSKLEYLDLSENKLREEIPLQICNLSLLDTMDLSYNFISGEIPPQLGSLNRVQHLNLSHSILYGVTPPSLDSIYYSLDLSYNALEGPIPPRFLCSQPCTALIGNEGLCVNIPDLPPCSTFQKKKSIIHYIKIFLPIAFFLVGLIFGLWFLSQHKPKKITLLEARAAKNGNLLLVWNYDGSIAYEDIMEATEDFNIKYCVGTGGYGSVYRARLPCGEWLH